MDMHFKTSHVIVYQLPDLCLYLSDRISKHLMLLFIDGIDPEQIQKDHFKTSHVIVYPGILGNMQNESYDFKTSHVIVYLYELPTRSCKTIFQNISCYCLSLFARFQLIILLHFKTSHVIVYPREYEKCGTVHGISKHLMLLFIF